MKILAVDDDPVMLELLKAAMANAGIVNVALARSAMEAAEAIADAESPFDCVFIDFKMPEINGDHLCSWIRSLPSYAATPLIMVTALVDKPAIERAFAVGATDYITKPIVLSDLNSRLILLKREVSMNRSLAGNEPQEELTSARQQEQPGIVFSKAFKVGGVKDEIELSAMENYLVQLSRTGLQDMSVFSIAIKDAAKLHLTCSREVFVRILATVGEAVSALCTAPHFFISYAGYGAFVGLIESKSLSSAERDTREESIRILLAATKFASRDGVPIRIEPCMAMPRRLGTWSGKKVVDVLYHVIGEAEERCSQR